MNYNTPIPMAKKEKIFIIWPEKTKNIFMKKVSEK